MALVAFGVALLAAAILAGGTGRPALAALVVSGGSAAGVALRPVIGYAGRRVSVGAVAPPSHLLRSLAGRPVRIGVAGA